MVTAELCIIVYLELHEVVNIKFPKYLQRNTYKFNLEPFSDDLRQLANLDWEVPGSFKIEKKFAMY